MRKALWMVALIASAALSCQEANAACHVMDTSRTSIIKQMGGGQTKLLKIYRTEGFNCYIGNHGSSFGPFQLHYGGRHNIGVGNRGAGLGDVFTKQTGLNARDPHTVPAQIRFMRRWGVAHGGFSSSIWHGTRWRHHRR